LASWDELDRLRDALDQLPEPHEFPVSELRDELDDLDVGPSPPDKFFYQGIPHDCMSTKVFRLIATLWTAPNRTKEIRDLAGPVWEDANLDITKNQIGSLRKLRPRLQVTLHQDQSRVFQTPKEGPAINPHRCGRDRRGVVEGKEPHGATLAGNLE
jgi:hypothetical protein